MNTVEIIGMQRIAGTALNIHFIADAFVIDCQHNGITIIKSGLSQSFSVISAIY